MSFKSRMCRVGKFAENGNYLIEASSKAELIEHFVKKPPVSNTDHITKRVNPLLKKGKIVLVREVGNHSQGRVGYVSKKWLDKNHRLYEMVEAAATGRQLAIRR